MPLSHGDRHVCRRRLPSRAHAHAPPLTVGDWRQAAVAVAPRVAACAVTWTTPLQSTRCCTTPTTTTRQPRMEPSRMPSPRRSLRRRRTTLPRRRTPSPTRTPTAPRRRPPRSGSAPVWMASFWSP
eukprot:5235915-Prymnesium_polylepis.1